MTKGVFVPFGFRISTIIVIDVFWVITKPKASQPLADEMRAALGWHTPD